MGAIWNMSIWNYTSDDTNTYFVGLSGLVAAIGGFGPSTSGVINFPRGWKMRKVYGYGTAGTNSVPCGSAGNTLYVSGGTYSIHGNSYTVKGRIGEKRRVRV